MCDFGTNYKFMYDICDPVDLGGALREYRLLKKGEVL